MSTPRYGPGSAPSSSQRRGLFERIGDRLAPPISASGQVKLKHVSRDHIQGELALGRSAIAFESMMPAKGNPRATVSTLAGFELIALSSDDKQVRVSFGGGQTTATLDRSELAGINQALDLPVGPAREIGNILPSPPPEMAVAAAMKKAESVATVATRAYNVQGDSRFLNTFFGSREYSLLPELSYALGLAGATGRDYRPSLALHAMGLGAGKLLGVNPSSPGVVYRYKLPPKAKGPDPRALFEWHSEGDKGCWSGYEDGVNDENLPPCPKPCKSYPNRQNDCFGMCGPGCSDCWDWICGDCCYHDFCAEHDALLRECEGEADIVACVNSVSILGTFILGCDRWLW